MKQATIVLLAILVAGCAIDNPAATNTRVFIRKNGVIQTSYELGPEGKILYSSTKDRNGGAISRRYAYDARNELVSVSRERKAGRDLTVYVSHETDRSGDNRLSRTMKTLVDSKGASAQMQVKYFYTEKGRLDGMMQTDSGGNIQAKSADD